MLAFLTLVFDDSREKLQPPRIEVKFNNKTLGCIGDNGFRVGVDNDRIITLSPNDLREIATKTEECVREAELRKDPVLNQRFLTGLLVLMAILLMPISMSAQRVADFQTRPIGHVQYDFYKNSQNGFFGAGWVIGNGRYYGTNNVNILAGVGYRQKTEFEGWWFESMIQRQWSEKGPALLWDNRF